MAWSECGPWLTSKALTSTAPQPPVMWFDRLPCQTAFIQVSSVNLGQILADAPGAAVYAVIPLSACTQALAFAFFAVHDKLAMTTIHVSGEACSNHVCKT